MKKRKEEPLITTAKVQLYCKELRRYKLTEDFHDSHGIAVGATYNLDEFGNVKGPYEWELRKILEVKSHAAK